MRQIDEIIVHCSATRAGQPFTAADIKRWHRQRGWRTIGYHYVVDLDGMVEVGRPVAQVGAHCINHNANSIGVCYIGGLDAQGHPADTRTDAQKRALRTLLEVLIRQYCAPVFGHRDFSAKACPCFDARAEYADIYADLLARQRADIDATFPPPAAAG